MSESTEISSSFFEEGEEINEISQQKDLFIDKSLIDMRQTYRNFLFEVLSGKKPFCPETKNKLHNDIEIFDITSLQKERLHAYIDTIS